MSKPPIGLTPRSVWDGRRKKSLLNAIVYYVEAGEDVPQEWLDEYEELSSGNKGRLNYIIVIVDKIDVLHMPLIIGNVKIEFVEIGHRFHGRHFRGQRPTHVVDISRTRKWFDHMKRATHQAEWITGEGN